MTLPRSTDIRGYCSTERAKESARRLRWAIALACLLHAATWPLLTKPWPLAPPPARQTVRLVQLSPQQLARALQKKREPVKKAEPESPPEDGQVVDVPPAEDSRAPEDTAFLAEHNSRVERQTKSRHQRSDYERATREPTRKTRVAAEPSPRRNAADPIRRKAPAEVPKLKRQTEVALEVDPFLGVLTNRPHHDATQGKGQRLRLGGSPSQDDSEAQEEAQPGLLDLVPQAGVISRVAGAPANDHLEDVEEGEGTFLNTKEFKFAAFFNRVKSGVSQHWRARDEYRRRDPSGHIYGQQSRVTVLKVTLDGAGSLKTVEVSRSSGLEFLDRQAVLAFRHAQPFPNPPSGLVDNQGLITFAFGFHLIPR